VHGNNSHMTKLPKFPDGEGENPPWRVAVSAPLDPRNAATDCAESKTTDSIRHIEAIRSSESIFPDTNIIIMHVDGVLLRGLDPVRMEYDVYYYS